MPLLFSYGTLQQAAVQMSTFGRLLQGGPDELLGFERTLMTIEDPQFVAVSGQAQHAIVRFTGRADSRVAGTVFEVSDDELAAADRYEPAGYVRVSGRLASGKSAWVYAAQRPFTSVRAAERGDRESWARMRDALWPAEPNEHRAEIDRYFAGELREPVEVLLALDERGEPIGFIELSVRAHGEGCVTDRVAWVEGWYVEPHGRRAGAGAALIAAAETWARGQGCTELGSDTEVDNLTSTAAHRALGFVETAVIRCFKKAL